MLLNKILLKLLALRAKTGVKAEKLKLETIKENEQRDLGIGGFRVRRPYRVSFNRAVIHRAEGHRHYERLATREDIINRASWESRAGPWRIK